MTDKERMAQVKAHQELLKDTLVPLLSQDGKKGMVAMRIFYTVAHGDGTTSAGQLGACCEGRTDDASRLIRSILALLMDIQKNAEFEARAAKPRH